MMKPSWKPSLILLPCILFTGCAQKYQQLGTAPNLSKTDQIQLSAVLDNPNGYHEKTIRLAGTIDDVCARRGCWVTMSDQDRTLRVKFTCPIEGRFVPEGAKGHQAIVEGKFEYKEIPEEEARHYLEDRGASAEEIAAIVGPQMEFYMFSEGILIQGGEDIESEG